MASDGASGDLFGVSVALEGDTAVIGTEPAASDSHGAAYVFTRSGTSWNEQAKLVASDSAPSDYLGPLGLPSTMARR